MLFCVSMIGIFAFLSKLALSLILIETVNRTTLISKDSQNYANQTNNINTKVNRALTIQSEYVSYSSLLREITLISNQKISYNLIRVDSNANNVSLSGKSSDRDSLLELKEKMEKSEFFTGIELPLSNLLEKNDIYFDIKASLNLDHKYTKK